MKVFAAKYWFLLTNWQQNSLKFRLVLSALLMVLILLPIIGFTLTNAFEKQLTSAIKNELGAYSYSILAVAEVENQQLFMPELLLENQFNVIDSGLYGQIIKHEEQSPTQKNVAEVLWSSKSSLAINLPQNLPETKMGQNSFSQTVINGNVHFIYSFSVSFEQNQQTFPITLTIVKDQQSYLLGLNQFKQQLWLWLAVLMVVFLIIQLIWLMWTLKPLTVLSDELLKIEQGEIESLSKEYPSELQEVTAQLNILLQTEKNQRKRYRNALADLAHRLKNPLAIIQSQTDLSQSTTEQLFVLNQMIEHQLKRAQSAGEGAWHLGINLSPVVDKLIATLTKIHFNKDIIFSVEVADNAVFKGDEADLMEMLGNILDNACKASIDRVTISAKQDNSQLVITVSDNGQGIAPEIQVQILERGLRADTYKQGHGIGLAIVRDLVASYHGKLEIKRCPKLHGAMFVLQFEL